MSSKKIEIEIGPEIENKNYKTPCNIYKIVKVTINAISETGCMYKDGTGDDDFGKLMSSVNSYDNVAIRGSRIKLSYNQSGIILSETLIKTSIPAPARTYPKDPQKAAEYDRINNEGAEGYNPYR